MLTLASCLAENAQPIYERIAAWLAARLGEPATLLGGVAWEERLAMLDDGQVHVAFICGWPYTQRHDRQERLRAALLAMHEDAEGRAILADGLMVRFVPVQDADYDPIRAMAARAVTAGFLEFR